MAQGEEGDPGQPPDTTLEQAFSTIKDGKSLEKQGAFWKSADSFVHAHQLLLKLAADISVDDGETAETADNEQAQIRQLYEQQAREYFGRARQTLIHAMQQEGNGSEVVLPDKEEPEESSKESKEAEDDDKHQKANTISDEEAQNRLVLFARLFAREEDVAKLTEAKEEEEPQGGEMVGEGEEEVVDKQQMSLEERLMELNKSLPSGFKSSDERMRDINSGLNRLGMSLYSNADANNKPRLDMPTNKSETEQVDDIIAQAKDEVAMMQQHPTTDGEANEAEGPSVGNYFLDDAGDTDLSDDDASDDDDDAELSRKDLKVIQEKVNEAQAVLAKLNALLEEAVGDDEEAKELHDDEEVEFDHNSGKKALKDARVLLQQATQRWRESAI